MAKQRSSVQKREREQMKRQRERKKAEKTARKRERRLNRDAQGPAAPPEVLDVTPEADGQNTGPFEE
ncbi:MAG: hypothetical protein JXB13_16670 [Phycisphaerae bacterium]|nr:hypothetical protein [Phycisphaerae bacterium]